MGLSNLVSPIFTPISSNPHPRGNRSASNPERHDYPGEQCKPPAFATPYTRLLLLTSTSAAVVAFFFYATGLMKNQQSYREET
jgi:hypothetical protein